MVALGMLLFGALHCTHMMWQQGAWLCWADVTFYMSISMLLLDDFDDEDVRWQQGSLLV